MPTLVAANLTTPERRALDRFEELLAEDFGAYLHAVWLYGSRARGGDRAGGALPRRDREAPP